MIGAFPTPTDAYDRDNESRFRQMLAQEIQSLRSAAGSSGSSEFFNVRDYGSSTTTEWDDAFAAADAAAIVVAGVVLVPPGTYVLADNLEIDSPIMFAGGQVRPASGKTFTVGTAASVTALAGEWFDNGSGGSVVRPAVSHLEDGLDAKDDLDVGGEANIIGPVNVGNAPAVYAETSVTLPNLLGGSLVIAAVFDAVDGADFSGVLFYRFDAPLDIPSLILNGKTVSEGVADSGGAGFKLLRVSN